MTEAERDPETKAAIRRISEGREDYDDLMRVAEDNEKRGFAHSADALRKRAHDLFMMGRYP